MIPYSHDPAEVLKALHGSVVRYDDPLEPVGVEDWDGKIRDYPHVKTVW